MAWQVGIEDSSVIIKKNLVRHKDVTSIPKTNDVNVSSYNVPFLKDSRMLKANYDNYEQ